MSRSFSKVKRLEPYSFTYFIAGDPIQISSNLFAKYQPVMQSGCNSDILQRLGNTTSKQRLELSVIQRKYHGRNFRSSLV